jgi:hypothetical protein
VTTKRSNLALLIDKLGDTRAAIAALEERDAELREQISEIGVEHHDTRWAAEVTMWRRPRVDTKALRDKHPKAAAECTVTGDAMPFVSVRPEISEEEDA